MKIKLCEKCGAVADAVAKEVPNPNARLGKIKAVQRYVCPKCVTPETIILGLNKPIAMMEVGDDYIGAEGIGHVHAIYSRPYNGDVVVARAVGILPIQVTPEHPFLATSSRANGGQFSDFHWKEAIQLVPKKNHKMGDYLLLPRIKGKTELHILYLSPFTTTHGLNVVHGKKLPDRISLDEKTAWLMGLYVAEGVSCKEVLFCLGTTEIELQQKLKAIIRGLGYSPYVKRRGSVTIISMPSRLLARAFLHWFGRGATNKKIPEFLLLHKDNAILKSFLDGYIAGDGCVDSVTRVAAKTVSKILALQLQLLCARLGLFLTVRKVYDPHVGVIQGRTVNMSTSFEMVLSDFRRESHAKLLESYIACPVRSVKLERYEGKVYNLETNGNTYLVSNTVVHNCGWRSKLRF